jgi:hypothetical protein
MPNFVYIFLLFVVQAAGAALKNVTITVPDGASDHGDSGLL